MIKNLTILGIIFILFSSNIVFGKCEIPEMPSENEWSEWINYISKEAKNIGISKNIIDKELVNVRPIKKIILRDRCQPESTMTFKEYLYYRLDKTRIYTGQNKIKEYKKELEIISSTYDIQSEFIIAIWGLESYYGKNQGDSKIIPALVTLSFDKRRSEFYKKQLLAALEILEKNYANSDLLLGSWAGAMGQVQFLPTTYLESAVDFNNDGKKDIWNTKIDVFASIANYLTSLEKAPWNNKVSWGIEVIPPNNIGEIYESLKKENPKGCYAVKTMSKNLSLEAWNKLGFKSKNLKELDYFSNLEARLVAPDGLDGRFFLVFKNYKSILYYNCSHYYALTVGLLSDKIK